MASIEEELDAALLAVTILKAENARVWELHNDFLNKKMISLQKEIHDLRAENARYREALKFGLNEMMPQIKAQKGCWPGEVDDFEDRAREALKGE